MSSYYSGHNGKLYLDDKELARVANWNFSSSLNLLDTTALTDTDSSSTPGIRSNSGSCRIYFYKKDDDGNDCSTLIKNLVKQKKAGDKNANIADLPNAVKLKLYIDTGGDGNYIEGNAYLQNVSMAMAVGEVLSADVQFQFTGALTGVVL